MIKRVVRGTQPSASDSVQPMTNTSPVTVADIRHSYAPEKRREELYGEWAAVLLYRPVSFLVTPLFLRLSIGASAVTLASLALGLALPFLAWMFPPFPAALAGGIGVAFCILDCVDGNIARVTGTVSRLGHYLDFVTDVVFRVAFYITIGIVGGVPLFACALAALLAVGARLCRVYAERFSDESVYARPESSGGGGVSGFLFPFLSGLDSLLPVAVILAGWFGGLGWVVAWLLFYSALDFGYTHYAVLRRLR